MSNSPDDLRETRRRLSHWAVTIGASMTVGWSLAGLFPRAMPWPGIAIVFIGLILDVYDAD